MPDVTVTAVAVAFLNGSGNSSVFKIFNFCFTRIHLPCIKSPRSDDFKIGSKSLYCKLKTNLVVSFSCCTVADSCCAFLTSDFNKSFCDDGSCHWCTEKIFSFVNSVSLYTRENSVCNKFFCKILKIKLACTCFKCSFFKTFCFWALSYVCTYGNNFSIVVVFF